MGVLGYYELKAAAMKKTEAPDQSLFLSETGFLISPDRVSYPQLFPEEGLQQCARIVFRSFCFLHASCAGILAVQQGIASGHGVKVVGSLHTSRLLLVIVRILFFTWKKNQEFVENTYKSLSSKHFSTHSITTQVITEVT